MARLVLPGMILLISVSMGISSGSFKGKFDSLQGVIA